MRQGSGLRQSQATEQGGQDEAARLAGTPAPDRGQVRAITDPRSVVHPRHRTRFLDCHGYALRPFKVQGQVNTDFAQQLLSPINMMCSPPGLKQPLAGRNVEAGDRAHLHDHAHHLHRGFRLCRRREAENRSGVGRGSSHGGTPGLGWVARAQAL
jgi:hypothetical protein